MPVNREYGRKKTERRSCQNGKYSGGYSHGCLFHKCPVLSGMSSWYQRNGDHAPVQCADYDRHAQRYLQCPEVSRKKQVDGIVLLRDLEHDRLLQYLTEIHFPAGLSGTCDYEEIIQVDIDNKAASNSLVSLLIGQATADSQCFLGKCLSA